MNESFRNIQLRAVSSGDVELLRMLEFTSIGPGWRSRGSTPSPEQYEALIWSGVLAQVLAVDQATGELVGWYQCYSAEFENGIAWFGAARPNDADPTRFGLGAALFLNHLFSAFSFRKLFLEVPANTYEHVQVFVGSLLVEEGCLRERVFAAGEYRDVSLLGLTRQSWQESAYRHLLDGSAADNG